MSQTVEHVRDNIAWIVDNEGEFKGTCFFLEVKQNKYCITCHHCICRLDEIYVARGRKKKWLAKWIKELSNMKQDIAVLRVDNCDIQALRNEKEALASLPVSLWGHSDNELINFPSGAPSEIHNLSKTFFPFSMPKEIVNGNHEWNKKPQVNVNVYQYVGRFYLGNSGAPVCYDVTNNVIGVFTALDNERGWVIPVQTVVEKFRRERKVAEPSPPVNMLYYISKGNKSYNSGHYSEALKQYEKVLRNTNYVKALRNKGVTLSALEKYEEAIEYFDKVLAINGNDVDALGSKAAALTFELKYKEAIKYFDKVLAINGNDIDTLAEKAYVLIFESKYKEALECFDKVLDSDRNDISALGGKGAVFLKLKQPKKAIGYWDKLLAIDPNNSEALYGKGFALLLESKYEEAIDYFNAGLAVEKNHRGALCAKGLALIKMSQHDEAVKNFNKVLAFDPNNIQALFSVGYAYLYISKRKEAVVYFDKILAINPDNVPALKANGYAYLYESKRKKAVRYFDKVLAINPDDVDALGAKKLALDKQEADTPINISVTMDFTVTPKKVINKMT